ncbi:hypothetical protein QUF74_15935 [Candidatus Halobeggiatoa sp. HSG11]|nr:hypothetical protein [Candidatus Halobeggiatoa sp. HSG11]
MFLIKKILFIFLLLCSVSVIADMEVKSNSGSIKVMPNNNFKEVGLSDTGESGDFACETLDRAKLDTLKKNVEDCDKEKLEKELKEEYKVGEYLGEDKTKGDNNFKPPISEFDWKISIVATGGQRYYNYSSYLGKTSDYVPFAGFDGKLLLNNLFGTDLDFFISGNLSTTDSGTDHVFDSEDFSPSGTNTEHIFKRKDWDITVGIENGCLFSNLTCFIGYKSGKVERMSRQIIPHNNEQKAIDNIPTISTTTEIFNTNGFFIGASINGNPFTTFFPNTKFILSGALTKQLEGDFSAINIENDINEVRLEDTEAYSLKFGFNTALKNRWTIGFLIDGYFYSMPMPSTIDKQGNLMPKVDDLEESLFGISVSLSKTF